MIDKINILDVNELHKNLKFKCLYKKKSDIIFNIFILN